jgi:shikimate dehydrogenase
MEPFTLGLVGKSLIHSFSKSFFGRVFEGWEIPGTYKNFELAEINFFVDLPQSEPNLVGLNVTIPFKQAVLPFCANLDAIASEIQAANTLVLQDGAWWGYNTDAPGFADDLRLWLGVTPCPPTLILGTGGAALAVAYAVQHLLGQSDVAFLSRSANCASANLPTYIYGAQTPELLAHYRLVVNTTPLGTFPDLQSCPPLRTDWLGPSHYVYDLVYNPAETTLLWLAAQQGAHTRNGLGMLVRQAQLAWEIWVPHLADLPAHCKALPSSPLG